MTKSVQTSLFDLDVPKQERSDSGPAPKSADVSSEVSPELPREPGLPPQPETLQPETPSKQIFFEDIEDEELVHGPEVDSMKQGGNPKDKDGIPGYFQGLNPEQLKAASHFTGPILVLAGAGSGKTRVLTHRIVHLIKEHKVRPQHIIAVTFTNKASKEMKERLEKLLGPQAKNVWCSTFHSSALRILRRHAKLLEYDNDFVVYDTQDSKGILKALIKELKIDDTKYPVSFFQKAIDRAKNNYIRSTTYPEHHSGFEASMIADVYDRYQRRLVQSNAMDFGDLLLNVVRLFKEHPDTLRMYQAQLKFLLVDEFQDTNKVQYMLIRMLAAPQNNLFVVGDDDQSIYAFRGATIENILHFEKDFPQTTTVKLEQNYRSTACILDSANSVIAKNSKRKAKKLWTASDQGSAIEAYAGFDEGDEAQFIARQIDELRRTERPLTDIAIFYRTNAQSRALEDALMQRAIPYRIYGGLKFYDRKEIKDILSYLRLLVNEADAQAFLRVVNTPPRGLGPKSVLGIIEHAKANNLSLLEAARERIGSSKHLKAFVELIDDLRKSAESIPIFELVDQVIERSGYGPKLREMKEVTAQSRLENLKELNSIAVTMSNQGDTPLDDLRLFLDRVSLTSSEELPVEDSRDEASQKEPPPTVSLMTLHLAKGLEYPIVFFTGLEEGLLPHYRSIDDKVAVAEERRLCYVGMTRAMEKLYLTRSRRRGMFSAGGAFGFSSGARKPSRFVFDIPPNCLANGAESFLEEGPTFELDDDFVDEPWGDGSDFEVKRARWAKKREKNQNRKKRSVTSLISTADSLSNPEDESFATLTRVEFEQIAPGLQVVHRTFGDGEVEAIEPHPSGDPKRAKIVVRFESFEAPKKLLFRHAKLAVR